MHIDIRQAVTDSIPGWDQCRLMLPFALFPCCPQKTTKMSHCRLSLVAIILQILLLAFLFLPVFLHVFSDFFQGASCLIAQLVQLF